MTKDFMEMISLINEVLNAPDDMSEEEAKALTKRIVSADKGFLVKVIDSMVGDAVMLCLLRMQRAGEKVVKDLGVSPEDAEWALNEVFTEYNKVYTDLRQQGIDKDIEELAKVTHEGKLTMEQAMDIVEKMNNNYKKGGNK